MTEGQSSGDGKGKSVTPAEVNKATTTTTTTTELPKIWARVKATKAREYPKFPSSETGGVMPMSIQSRFWQERQRLSGDFTDKWRKWRAQWIKDQTLHPAEPMHVKELEKAYYNPIRRAYRAPWNWFEIQLAKYVGGQKATLIRHGITKTLLLYGATLWIYYILKYHQRTWEDSAATFWPYVMTPKAVVLPGDPAYPSLGTMFHKEEYYDLGFSKRKALRFDESAARERE